MSYRVFIVEEENILKHIREMILWYYVNAPKECNNLYIGDIIIGKTFFESKENKDKILRNKDFKGLSKVVGLTSNPIFSKNELIELEKELLISEKLGVLIEEDLEIIKTGIKIALEKNLYLRFEWNWFFEGRIIGWDEFFKQAFMVEVYLSPKLKGIRTIYPIPMRK